MAWTISSNEHQVGNTIYRFWDGVADNSELTTEIIFNCSDYLKTDGTATTQSIVSYLRIASASGMHSTIFMDATTDELLVGCPGGSVKEFPPTNFPRDILIAGSLVTTTAAGATGDLVVTTNGASAGDGFFASMIMELV